MATVEKLVFQIFDRKNWIIEQVKQQTYLYEQHLASKLLINGIPLPPWFLNSNFPSLSSDPKDLNKEELISDLLFPQARSTIPYSFGQCSLFSKLVVDGNNGEILDGLPKETQDSNKGVNAVDVLTNVPMSHGDDLGYTSHCVPELDSTSPHGQADKTLFNSNTTSGQLPANVQSLSLVKLIRGELLDGSGEEIPASTEGLDATKTDDDPGYTSNYGPESSPQEQTDVRFSKMCTAPDQSLARFHRSRSRQKALELRNSAKAAPKSHLSHENETSSYTGITFCRIDPQEPDNSNELAKEAESSDINRRNFVERDELGGDLSNDNSTNSCSGDTCKQVSSINEPPKLDRSHEGERRHGDRSRESCMMRQAKGIDQSKENGTNSYHGRITGSRSSCIHTSAGKLAHPVREHGTGPCVGRITRSMSASQQPSSTSQKLDKENEILEVAKPSADLGGRGKRSQNSCSNKGQLLHVKSAMCESNINQEEKVQSAVEAKPVVVPIVGHPRFGSNVESDNVRIGSEGLVLRSASDNQIVVKPKQLDFDDMEQSILNETFSPRIRRSLEKSSKSICRNSLEPSASLDKLTSDHPFNVFLEKQSSGKNDASIETKEVSRSFKTISGECNEKESSKLKHNINANTLGNYTEDESLVEGIHNPPALRELNVASSDDHKSSTLDMHKLKCHLTEGCPELHVEEGHLCNQRCYMNEIVPSTLQQQCSGASLVSSFTEQATGDPMNCLDQEVDLANPAEDVLDAGRISRVDSESNLLPLEHRFDRLNTADLSCSERMSLLDETKNFVEGSLDRCSLSGDPRGKDEYFDCLTSMEVHMTCNSSVPECRSSSIQVDSRSQFKWRKGEDQQANCLSQSPSPNSGIQKLHNIQEAPPSSYSKTVDGNSDTFSKLQGLSFSHKGNASKSSDMFNQEDYRKTYRIVSSPRLQTQEEEHDFEEQIKDAETPFAFNLKELGPHHAVSLSKQAARDSLNLFNEDDITANLMADMLAARNLCDEQNCEKLSHVENSGQVNDDVLTSTERNLLKRKCNLKEDAVLSCRSVGSSCNNDPAFDQNLPVLEGFLLNDQTDNVGLGTSRDGINFHEASILEQICRTASMCTPLSHFSSTFKSLKNKDIYSSVPNGVLEHADLRSTLHCSDDSVNYLRATSINEVESRFQGTSCSDGLPYSGAQFGLDSKNSSTPPVGKFCERFPSRSFSSEKRLSFNPELTCFPIEEDPCVSGENENADEVANGILEDFGEINSCVEREPLAEVSLNHHASVSAAEKFPQMGIFDSSNPEVHNSVKQRVRDHCSNKKSKNRGKENQMLSVGPNSLKKVSENFRNRSSKVKLSGTTSVKRGQQRLSEKMKRNNIVSNITSFVPLVQQKQAAAVCTGKRGIKVRALEAAEAAKRLEEKREQERKTKKEALKLERAKIEQENLRQRELVKKSKEEELKKKNADKAARKRLREEEERKEKEKKKKRIEVGWRSYKLQEEKVYVVKGEKEKPSVNMSKNFNNVKESDNSRSKDKKVQKVCGDSNLMSKSETEYSRTGVVVSNVQQGGIIPEDRATFSDCEGSIEAITTLDRSPSRINVAAKTTREKSYDISPYQCSDEEEEEEDLPTKKFIPSWASKNSVALVLPSQQHIDPSLIFPRESFCRMDEAILPRHLQK